MTNFIRNRNSLKYFHGDTSWCNNSLFFTFSKSHFSHKIFHVIKSAFFRSWPIYIIYVYSIQAYVPGVSYVSSLFSNITWIHLSIIRHLRSPFCGYHYEIFLLMVLVCFAVCKHAKLVLYKHAKQVLFLF